jgi:predicted ArsR family transcriptional regulator
MSDAPNPDEFSVERNYKRAGTSSNAAAAAAGQARRLNTHERIMAALRLRPRTADEISRDLGLVLNTSRARCTDLLNQGLIERTGETRPTGAGRPADVLKVCGFDNS